jgi:hypothetical protein
MWRRRCGKTGVNAAKGNFRQIGQGTRLPRQFHPQALLQNRVFAVQRVGKKKGFQGDFPKSLVFSGAPGGNITLYISCCYNKIYLFRENRVTH